MTEEEMMSDLAAADAAGDSQLAQHIAGQIKALHAPAQPLSIADRLKYAAHKTAGMLPMAGAVVGGTLGTGAGAALGIPTGPADPFVAAAGGAAGAGLLSAGGKGLQHMIDRAIGYEEDKPDTGAVLKDMASTGGRDTAFTGAGTLAAPVVGALAGKAAPALDSIGNKFARRVLSGGATPLTVKAPISDQALDAAQEAGAFKPWGTTQRASKVLDAARETQGGEYGRIVKALKGSGVTGPDSQALADEYAAKVADAQANTIGGGVPGVYGDAASSLRAQPAGPLDLEQAENMKRSLQDQASSSYKQMAPNEIGKAKEDAASILHAAVEKSIEQQASKAPAAAAAFVPVKQKLGSLIEASNAATKGAAMADRRQMLSLTDMLAAGAGASHSPAHGMGALLLSKMGRTFGPSAGAWAGKGSADLLESMAAAPGAARVGAEMGAATAEKPDELTPGQLLQQLLLLARSRSQAATQ